MNTETGKSIVKQIARRRFGLWAYYNIIRHSAFQVGSHQGLVYTWMNTLGNKFEEFWD